MNIKKQLTIIAISALAALNTFASPEILLRAKLSNETKVTLNKKYQKRFFDTLNDIARNHREIPNISEALEALFENKSLDLVAIPNERATKTNTDNLFTPFNLVNTRIELNNLYAYLHTDFEYTIPERISKIVQRCYNSLGYKFEPTTNNKMAFVQLLAVTQYIEDNMDVPLSTENQELLRTTATRLSWLADISYDENIENTQHNDCSGSLNIHVPVLLKQPSIESSEDWKGVLKHVYGYALAKEVLSKVEDSVELPEGLETNFLNEGLVLKKDNKDFKLDGILELRELAVYGRYIKTFAQIRHVIIQNINSGACASISDMLAKNNLSREITLHNGMQVSLPDCSKAALLNIETFLNYYNQLAAPLASTPNLLETADELSNAYYVFRVHEHYNEASYWGQLKQAYKYFACYDCLEAEL